MGWLGHIQKGAALNEMTNRAFLMCGMVCTIDGSIVYTLSNAGRSSGVGSFGGVCSRSGILRTRGEEFVLISLKVTYPVSNGGR